MRKIKFRGQRQSDSKWIYGDLLQPTELCDIYEISDCESVDGSRYDVIKDTIGQYIGIEDKNGKEIYEGDIINIEYPETTIEKAVVECLGTSFYGSAIGDTWELDGYYEIEVIGNLWDNPWLDDERWYA